MKKNENKINVTQTLLFVTMVLDVAFCEIASHANLCLLLHDVNLTVPEYFQIMW